MTLKHQHAEAYMLMVYTSHDGAEQEVLWNSRDGVTPFMITGRSGEELAHRTRLADHYAPGHVPAVGDRIFVDLTLQRARVFAAAQIERLERGSLAGRRTLEEQYASREAAVEDWAQQMLVENGGGRPDILVVTAGYIEELQTLRAQRAVPSGEERMVPRPGADAPRSAFYDRQCQPISFVRFMQLFETPDYKCIARTVLDGDKTFVSTIWLGIDHAWGGGTPLIFETMTRENNKWGGDQYRYATEGAALAGHEVVVAELRTRLGLPPSRGDA
jgi:hypothetical protein